MLFSTQGQSLAAEAHTVLTSMLEDLRYLIAFKFLMGISESWELGLTM